MRDYKRLHETLKARYKVLASLPECEHGRGAMQALEDVAVWMGYKRDLGEDTEYQLALRTFVRDSFESGLEEVCFGYCNKLIVVKRDKGFGYHWKERNSKPAAHSNSLGGLLDGLFATGW